MANLVGSAVISGLVEIIFDKLGSPAFQEIGRVIGVKGELKRLKNTMSDIRAVLRGFSETVFQCWTSIQNIVIIDCVNLRYLPEQIGSLTTLRILQIIHCPCLCSLPNGISNLTNLAKLAILDCQKLNLMRWEGLLGLRSLQELRFHRLPLLENFPDGLESIGGSLRHLKIISCQNLRALPECLQHCTCLLHLTLFKCSSLTSLPKGIQALNNLQQLSIADCSELNPRCEREVGEDWHLISHIPIIQVDRCFIQNKVFPTC